MTTTMEENDMNEPSQIRERFLADARQHFFAANSTSGKNPPTTRQNNNPCRCTSDEQYCGKSGA